MVREMIWVTVILLYCKWASGQYASDAHSAINVQYNNSCHDHSCLNTTKSFHQFLEEVKTTTSDSVHMCICANASLDTIVTFDNIAEVTIIGKGNQVSKITCSSKSTGFNFTHVNRVRIEGVSMDQCGGCITGENSPSLTFTSIDSIVLHDVALTKSKSIGVQITDVSSIIASFLNITLSSGRGMGITGSSNHSITIKNSSFFGNNYNYPLFSSRNRTRLNDAGGGIYVKFCRATSAFLEIIDTNLIDNRASHGGGIAIDEEISTNNHNFLFINLVVKDCSFIRNAAENGGGVYVLMAFIRSHGGKNCSIKFIDTTWKSNVGFHGSAVMIKPCTKCQRIKYLKFSPIFKGCNFVGNKAHQLLSRSNCSNYNLYWRSKGSLFIRKTDIKLQGYSSFMYNEASAIYAVSSNLIVSNQSVLNFTNNHGYRGGAIALYSTSKIILENNVELYFERNNASHKGGAIYQKTSNEENTRFQCFIRNRGTNSNSNHLTFSGNKAGHTGNSLYLTTLKGCKNYKKINNCSGILLEYAHFHFSECTPSEIETVGNYNNITDFPPLKYAIPGKPTDLGISIIDDTGKPISAVIKAVITANKSSVNIDSAYNYITNNKILLLGDEGAEATVMLNWLNHENSLLEIKMVLQRCPPGLISLKQMCVCSAFQVNTTLNLDGIDTCDMEEFKAHLQNSYWAGYLDPGNETKAEFTTNICPIDFCDESPKDYTGAWLPQSTDTFELTEAVCSPNKMGVLCGKCAGNYSVGFHDASYSCKENKRCEWGVPLYLISELVPATIFFTLMISLDITFTSGTVSGFIFYVQIFDSLLISGNHATWFNSFSGVLLKALFFIVRMFNLSFFSLSELSFCLIKGADALDMIAFQYFTLIYCFFLIIFTIALKNKCSIKFNFYFGLKKTQLSDSFIHGLSSFLVICYFQGTKISFLLLSFVRIGGSDKRVFYNGDVVFMGDEHVKYAIPAILFLIFVTVLPPVLLLSYPLCYRVLALFKLQESRFTIMLCKCIPLEKYKPVFDSFQSTFKDEHRYFSGLHFIFRCLILVLILLHKDLINSYVILDLLFLAMLTLHATQRPYRNDWHNTLDNFMYSLLIVLNTISLFNYHRRMVHTNEKDIVPYTSFIQVLLAWIPLVCMLAYLSNRCVRVVREVYLSRRKPKRDANDFTSSIIGLEEERENMAEMDYEKYHTA